MESSTMPGDTVSLTFAERWLRDGLQVLRPSLMLYQVTVDMSRALTTLEALRQTGIQATPTHILVRAVAMALAANPQLHQVVAGWRRQRPGRVDIGLSITGESFVDPVVVIEGADKKTVAEIADEVTGRVPSVRQADRELRATLNRWGWVLPFGVLRRALLRGFFANPSFRRKGAGTFQVSTVPVDWAAGATFTATGLLVGGSVVSKVLVVEGQVAVRPAMTLTLCGDHGIWDGRAAARFLAAVREQLDSG